MRIAAAAPRPEVYAEFGLTADLSGLSANQRQLLVLLFEASQIMDDLFWRQAYGDDYEAWLDTIGVDSVRRFAAINYGPWDRLADEAPFMDGVGVKPLGARFYPSDMTAEEFDAAELDGKIDLYSFVRRNDAGELYLVPPSRARLRTRRDTAPDRVHLRRSGARTSTGRLCPRGRLPRTLRSSCRPDRTARRAACPRPRP